jgi:serine phosphatase RsbU (regulator of sigma subunit)
MMVKILLKILLVIVATNVLYADFSIQIDAKKDSFYNQLTGPEHGYLYIPHTDFLPLIGPQPRNDADLSAKIWVAWDSLYLYLYAEVKDDTIRVNHSVGTENDCIELKIDPDPTQKAWIGIVNARLTALDSIAAENLQGVDNLYSDEYLDSAAKSPDNYARRYTEKGYAVELRLKWDWIKTDDRSINVVTGNKFGFAINIHDNDSSDMDASIQWSAGMSDEVWRVPQLLGSAELLSDHKIRLIRQNAIDPQARPGFTYLSATHLERVLNNIILLENWLYHPGDYPSWADPNLDDTNWEIVHPVLTADRLPKSGWDNFGWFRTHIVVDSSLWGVPLGLRFSGLGASEIYLNGDSLYQFGKAGMSAHEEEQQIERNPRYIIFKNQSHHVLAIRYSNFSSDYILNFLRGRAGFNCVILNDFLLQIDNHVAFVREMTIFEIAFMVIPILLGLLHLFLFIFYPNAKENLYFSLAMFCWAVIIFSNFQNMFLTNPRHIFSVIMLGSMAISPAIVFGLITLYAMLYDKIPKQLWIFVAIAAVVMIWIPIKISSTILGILIYGLIGLATLEIVRIIIVHGIKKWQGRWLTMIGFAILMLALVYQILSDIRMLPSLGEPNIIYVYGLLAISITVSLDLSISYARTNRDLKKQLQQVKELSHQTLEQERRAREEELARKILEADNARKTQELEDARQLQLAMLPKAIPSPAHLEIAAEMRTANEVGGDYYDFYLSADNTLTVAIGDATGHGMRAGTMVASIKSLFAAFGNKLDIAHFFNRCTEIIKEMHMGNIFMGMMLLRINGKSLIAAAAGMPPVLIYRAKTDTIEELVLKGMPLGAHNNFVYHEKKTKIYPGDTILLMTDGFPELFNKNKEMLDYKRIKRGFKHIVDRSAKEIIQELIKIGDSWRAEEPQRDDYTFVVLKVRS